MNLLKKEILIENNTDSVLYCPNCLMCWGDDEERCPVCKKKTILVNTNEIEEVGVEYKCSCHRSRIFTSHFIKIGEEDKIKKKIYRFCNFDMKTKAWNLTSMNKRKYVK